MTSDDLHLRLSAITGAENVIVGSSDLAEPYGVDYTEEEPRCPAFIVRPDSAEQVQAIVSLVGDVGQTLTVRVAGSNVGGLAIPAAGGIVLDLSRMNRIIEVDPDGMVALIEPGVTWEQLKAHLEQQKLPLRMGYPLSPPDTSIVANCLLDGLGNLSMRYGSMAEWIGGIEAVLPTGERIRTGAAALSDRWFGRGPLPDLSGLFVCAQGMTGVVTKLAFQLWPEPEYRRRLFILMYDRNDAFEAMRRLCRLMICDDVGGLSWPTGKLLFGVEQPGQRDPDEPDFFLYVDITGQSSAELSLRLKMFDAFLQQLRDEGYRAEDPVAIDALIELNPRFSKFAEFPARLDFLTDHPGGGLTWVGTYGPMSRFEAYADAGVGTLARYDKPPIIVSRPMKGGHFGVMRFIALFNQADRAEKLAIRQLNRELIERGVELGFVPYKTPAWVVEQIASRLDPGFVRTLKVLRRTLDPKGVMSPHCWPL